MKTDRFRIEPGSKKVRLDRIATDATPGIEDEREAGEVLARATARLASLQERLYAQDVYGVLVIFQAMDAAGKDGTIKWVLSGVNPQGCQVYSFKAPSAEELDHDFMWRHLRCLPERGRIGVFNRSYYEECLVVRVHPELLERQKLPPAARGKGERLWEQRFEDINAIERYLVRNGIVVLKLFLHVSREEQLSRLIARLERPEKHWKFCDGDVAERELWDRYMDAYEDVLRETSTEHAPWYVVPADHKWYLRAAVGEILADRLEALDLRFPAVPKERRRALEELRRKLEREA